MARVGWPPCCAARLCDRFAPNSYAPTRRTKQHRAPCGNAASKRRRSLYIGAEGPLAAMAFGRGSDGLGVVRKAKSGSAKIRIEFHLGLPVNQAFQDAAMVPPQPRHMTGPASQLLDSSVVASLCSMRKSSNARLCFVNCGSRSAAASSSIKFDTAKKVEGLKCPASGVKVHHRVRPEGARSSREFVVSDGGLPSCIRQSLTRRHQAGVFLRF